MKGSMVKCLQCNTVSVYMAEYGVGHRCPICRGYTIPQGECNIVEQQVETETVTLYADGKEWLREKIHARNRVSTYTIDG